ncbi:hypothetical protein C8J56DRAFT_896440 [Mycena floridula]|nr:hypothetical protein C8J56DRAFT_896440 [Mycena floridula]
MWTDHVARRGQTEDYNILTIYLTSLVRNNVTTASSFEREEVDYSNSGGADQSGESTFSFCSRRPANLLGAMIPQSELFGNRRFTENVSNGSSSSISSFSSGTSSPIASSSPPLSPGPQDPKKTQSVVEAEAEQCQIERAITSSIELAYDDKIYMYNPDVHPGFQSDVLALTPAVLRPYHPQTTGAPIPDMDDVYRTHSGIGVAHFNSTIGLKMQNFRLLKTQSIHCRICDNYFSVHGFQMHTITGDDGIKYFSNVQALVAAVPRMKFRQYPLGVVPPNPVYAFNDAIARAWLSWNSRHDVSSHTWALISTSDQFCTRCQLSRSFAGHRIHLNVVGECRDPGEVCMLFTKSFISHLAKISISKKTKAWSGISDWHRSDKVCQYFIRLSGLMRDGQALSGLKEILEKEVFWLLPILGTANIHLFIQWRSSIQDRSKTWT